MDRTIYLHELETALRKKCPEQQVRDILADYADFFATGTAEGKSEAELCAEFGPPEQAALELENAGETRLRKRKWFIPVIVLLGISIVSLLWPFFIPKIEVINVFSIPQGPVNFWLAMLLPLVLECIFVLWTSQSNPPKKALNRIPRVVIACTVLSAAALAFLVYFVFWIHRGADLSAAEGFYGTTHIFMYVASGGTVISEILLLISAVLLMLWDMRGHKKAHWFLFCDTVLITLILNLASFLSGVNTDFTDIPDSAVTGVASCFLWAVLPNLAAAAAWWVIGRIISLRRAKA